MKTVTGRVISAEPISLTKAAKLLSGFASSDNCASQAVSAYLRRASAAFTELKNTHREIQSKETKPRSDARRERNIAVEFDGGKIPSRKSETVSEKEAIYSREQDEIKDDKKKKKKKNSKKNKVEDVIDEKVNEKLEEEQRNEERKERKKEKKKRKSDEEMGSEERKSKKKKKSKEIDG